VATHHSVTERRVLGRDSSPGNYAKKQVHALPYFSWDQRSPRDRLTTKVRIHYMLCSSLIIPLNIVDQMWKSAGDYDHRRIGNRVWIPDGCAAVTDDEGPRNATIPNRDGKAGPENDSEVRRPALSSLYHLRRQFAGVCKWNGLAKDRMGCSTDDCSIISGNLHEMNRVAVYRALYQLVSFREHSFAFRTLTATRIVGAACKK